MDDANVDDANTPALRLILTSITDELTDGWTRICGDLPNVTVHHGDIFATGPDAVVSPANSFGFMRGGIDGVYTKVFGPGVSQRLQQRIRERHHGELVIGAAEIVETGHAIPYVIAAPTMRVPSLVSGTVNPYLAARAVLILALHGRFDDGTPVRDKVQTIAFPGLGTGVGGVSGEDCARQVRAAYEDIVLGQFTFPRSLGAAKARERELLGAPARSSLGGGLFGGMVLPGFGPPDDDG